MNHLGNFIKKHLKQTKLSERELSRNCGLSHSYLNQLITGINPKTQKKISPTIGTLVKLSKGLNVSVDVLQKIAMGVPEEVLVEDKKSRRKLLNNLEKISNEKGILVGSNMDRIIPWEVWNQIKMAHEFLDSAEIDPSEFKTQDWSSLIKDISLIAKLHSEKQRKELTLK